MKTKPNLNNIEKALIKIAKQAIRIIQAEAQRLVIKDKIGYDGVKEDIATNGDLLAQKFYLQKLGEEFPDFGIIAEEDSLTIPSKTKGFTAHFTIDPVDGTKAYARNQSHGVGTMLSLVIDGKIVLTVIGDINSGDIYSYNVDSFAKRWRFGNTAIPLVANGGSLDKRYISIRPNPFEIPATLQKLITGKDKAFKSFEVESGSIGTHMARLWKGEIAAILLEPGHITPWDEAPVTGISEHMGFCFYTFDGKKFEQFVPTFTDQIVHVSTYRLLIHQSNKAEFESWVEKNA